jgi:hypothetical protein
MHTVPINRMATIVSSRRVVVSHAELINMTPTPKSKFLNVVAMAALIFGMENTNHKIAGRRNRPKLANKPILPRNIEALFLARPMVGTNATKREQSRTKSGRLESKYDTGI